VISNIESFYIDSSLDNDADNWQVEIGDSTGEFLAMLERNHEVRIELVTSAPGAAGHIFTGISDDIVFDQTGLMVVTGRDYSSLALDSTCPPVRFKSVKAGYVVANQARKLGFTNISLAKTGQVKKTIKTDGSETFWEFWYRLYRNEKMWLWVGPNGALIGNKLNYDQHISYYFGTPMQTDTRLVQSMHIPVEAVEIRKSTQGRLGSVWVMVKDGKKTFWVKGVTDPTMDGWLKRPFKIIQDTTSHDDAGGRKSAWEEIFEGKVGSLEIRLTVSDPTHIFQTNKIARVRIPEIGYGGEFFVVGWRMQADLSGYVQEIRLREKLIALSRRVPHEPVIPVPKSLPKDGATSALTEQEVNDLLAGLIPTGNHGDWADFFYKAAMNFHGKWDGDLFLACLLGISWVDTRITNIRENTGHHDGTEWHARESTVDPRESSLYRGQPPAPGTPVPEYEDTFANQIDTVESYDIAHRELGVGPMQLVNRKLKNEADDRMVSGGVTTTSITATKIDSYLKSKSNSPLSGFGNEHVASGKKHNVDPRLIVAISGAETSFATDPNAAAGIAVHNAWGMFDDHSNNIPYSSWPEGIEATAANLGGPTYIGGGLTTVAQIQIHWAPSGAANDPDGLNNNWTRNVTKFLQDLGGNPNDVTYKSTPDAAPKASASHDEYSGGRWDPESNIWIGGEAFAAALDAGGRDPTDGDQKSAMWEAGARYDGNFGNATGEIFSNKLRRAVMISPGFLKLAQAAISAIRTNSNSAADGNTSGTTSSSLLHGNWPSEADCLAAFTSGSWIGRNAPTDPSPAAPLPTIPFLQAKYYKEGRTMDIKWIVIHDMEAPESNETAQNVANMFAGGRTDGPASAHYCLDNENIVQCVKDIDMAYGVLGDGTDGSAAVGGKIDQQTLHFEHAGYASQTLADWQDEFSTAMLKMSAKLTAKKAKEWGIPCVHVTPGGLAGGQSGFAGHGDFTTAFSTPGGHVDPGSNFPWAQYMQLVNDAYNSL
jgi:prophage tail gpP-like protein